MRPKYFLFGFIFLNVSVFLSLSKVHAIGVGGGGRQCKKIARSFRHKGKFVIPNIFGFITKTKRKQKKRQSKKRHFYFTMEREENLNQASSQATPFNLWYNSSDGGSCVKSVSVNHFESYNSHRQDITFVERKHSTARPLNLAKYNNPEKYEELHEGEVKRGGYRLEHEDRGLTVSTPRNSSTRLTSINRGNDKSYTELTTVEYNEARTQVIARHKYIKFGGFEIVCTTSRSVVASETPKRLVRVEEYSQREKTELCSQTEVNARFLCDVIEAPAFYSDARFKKSGLEWSEIEVLRHEYFLSSQNGNALLFGIANPVQGLSLDAYNDYLKYFHCAKEKKERIKSRIFSECVEKNKEEGNNIVWMNNRQIRKLCRNGSIIDSEANGEDRKQCWKIYQGEGGKLSCERIDSSTYKGHFTDPSIDPGPSTRENPTRQI